MARFARDCIAKMKILTKKLETSLGPDTGDLCLRVGLHSGQVTAGVLRGDKSRFQLFGDTMNTAARIESTGEKNKIHVSSETASDLIAQGKRHWLEEREGNVHAKGKGDLITFWLKMNETSTLSTISRSSQADDEEEEDDTTQAEERPKKLLALVRSDSKGNLGRRSVNDDKTDRLISWNVDVLAKVLKQIVLRRQAIGTDLTPFADPEDKYGSREMIIDEVKEVIMLPRFDQHFTNTIDEIDSFELDPQVMFELREFVTTISQMYRDNPFHNFEHASHVTMSVVKLLSRIVAPDDKIIEEQDIDDHGEKIAALLHDHTYGITSDPLTQFACIFSALIHDVDHTGVPNSQLVKENLPIASVYGNKSVAEQNSVDISWGLLMGPEFSALRGAIYHDENEMDRFRQLVVNSVMATDIMDKDALAFRRARWEKAFYKQQNEEEDAGESCVEQSVNRKATIVIEHLIQASDVSHTMQHWHVYTKWNERLFHEMYKAYKEGRSETNPADNWYQGEIGFFDYYIIPLAMKLKTCGVFGVSSDEYLNYATTNRKTWEVKGKERVEEMIQQVTSLYS